MTELKIGDTVTAEVTVAEKRDDKRILKLTTTVSNQRGVSGTNSWWMAVPSSRKWDCRS